MVERNIDLQDDERKAIDIQFEKADSSKSSMLSFTEWALFVQSLSLATDPNAQIVRNLFDRVIQKNISIN